MKWLNKKGQATSIISLIPKPLIFILFILLLVIIGSLLNPVFNTFGIFCKTDGEVVKLSQSNIVSNIQLFASLPSFDEISGDSINPDGLFVDCRKYYNGSFHFVYNTCSSCEDDAVIYNAINEFDLCVDDAYRIEPEDLSFWKRYYYCALDVCEIPENYYFEQDTGLYECISSNCGNTKLSASRDAKLDELGSIPYYDVDESDTHYSKVFRLSCTDKLRVEPSVAGVPIFNPAFWVLIMIGVILVWLIINFFPKK